MTGRLHVALSAARWLGTREGSPEHREILAAYNAIKPLPRGYTLGEKDPWCAGFVSAAAVMAGEGARYPLECSCSRIIEKAKRTGIWVEDDAHVLHRSPAEIPKGLIFRNQLEFKAKPGQPHTVFSHLD